MIAHYLLMHLNSLEQLTIKKVIDDVGISKASLHRFFSKDGYESFKDLITILDEEVKQKKMFNIDYQQYRSNMAWSALETEFEDHQIRILIKTIKKLNELFFMVIHGRYHVLKDLVFIYLIMGSIFKFL
ncbi:hypothetical protein LIP86_00560 [Erysipelatoclostridium ramosum]|uniref:hypothetical protein n=1 Tax=Thomasclavelia TaxID=3025755 RepID=UPI001D021687|nr:hypothetical protein [Thomasclavelia ramosa]MCB5398805.1 hypothetical protein [Thomasclavelia ramosa]MCB5412615.1 hypothetical protein [Thomasclavelia ramosa]MCB5416201.1 hypothetical protein [Thomasclavelia ramosa]MCB5435538.1 hypothetical protein [Thomasclavelia ramosa]MCB5452483.1 hypothetical protein [Thomasclavelia ramosa]